MALTPGQKQCVDTLVGPVAVSPVQAAERRLRLPAASFIRSNAGFVSGIDEVLAITFTSKAAGRDQVACEGRAQGLWAD